MNIPINAVTWVEIPVLDLGRAEAFYGAVFGWTFEHTTMHGLEMAMISMYPEQYGASGALVCGTGYVPAQYGVRVYLHCDDVTNALARVVYYGGGVVLSTTPIEPWGFVGEFLDCEGNLIALHCPPQTDRA
ncbi:MAG: VOC family protein [Alphaproteobacteria bacterium]|nr:MAG: VOC family protein [Alphaproteobacteria bacterium]